MPSQGVRVVVRPASDDISTHDIEYGRGDHDGISDFSGPPDYATIDPNEINRSVTPFPRPKSPTPSQQTAWPLADDSNDEDRPRSATSCTSSRHYSSGCKSKKRALSPSSTLPKSRSRNTLQIPALARLVSRRSERALPQVGSAGSFLTTSSNNRLVGGQKKRGLASAFSHGDWTTIGSFFSQSANSGSPHRGVTISRPYNFRHEGGMGFTISDFMTQPDLTVLPSFEEQTKKDEQTGTSAVLMDMRTESRLANRTSLPVSLPNAISPIDATAFGAGCGRSSPIRASVRTTFNRFQSPPSSKETIIHRKSPNKELPGAGSTSYNAHINKMKSSTSWMFWIMAALTQICLIINVVSITVAATNAHNDEKVDGGAIIVLVVSLIGVLLFGTLLACSYAQRLTGRLVRERTATRMETIFFKMPPEQVVYWCLLILAEVALISTVAAITVIAIASHADEEVDTGVLAWLVISLVLLLMSGLVLAVFYAHRVSNHIVRRHRAEQRDEEWIEMCSEIRPNFSLPGDHGRLARDIIKSASQDVHHRHPDHARRPSFTSINEHDDIMAERNIENPHASLIGIARSDSLMHSLDNHSTPSMSSNTTASVETYESEHTEKHIISKRLSPPATRIISDPISVLSAEELSMISVPQQQKPAYIPHSLGMANLSSEAPAHPTSFITASGTKSTISSLISSYASEPGGPQRIPQTYSSESLGRRDDTLRSYPVFASLRPIVTEAGTPNSQKSGGRIPASGIVGDFPTSWSVRDGLATRMATMSPIEERSEAGTRSSGLTGHRFSLSQGSDF